MIKIKNIAYGYKKNRPLFSDFSFEPAPQGGICGLLGENGAGKSTLLHLMSGLLLAQKGSITLNGTDVSKRLPSTLRETFLVPEEFNFPAMNVKAYVGQIGAFYPRFSHEDFARNLRLFEMEGVENLTELSMGQKKKVFIALALAANTQVLLMDEPTNGLDINGKSQFRKLAAVVAEGEKRTWIISTHQVKDIEQLIDRVAILHNNNIVLNESVSDIARRLCFVDVPGAEVPAEAFAAMPTFNGSRVMLRNDEGIDSAISLELLFNGALAHTEEVKKLFSPL